MRILQRARVWRLPCIIIACLVAAASLLPAQCLSAGAADTQPEVKHSRWVSSISDLKVVIGPYQVWLGGSAAGPGASAPGFPSSPVLLCTDYTPTLPLPPRRWRHEDLRRVVHFELRSELPEQPYSWSLWLEDRMTSQQSFKLVHDPTERTYLIWCRANSIGFADVSRPKSPEEALQSFLNRPDVYEYEHFHVPTVVGWSYASVFENSRRKAGECLAWVTAIETLGDGRMSVTLRGQRGWPTVTFIGRKGQWTATWQSRLKLWLLRYVWWVLAAVAGVGLSVVYVRRRRLKVASEARETADAAMG